MPHFQGMAYIVSSLTNDFLRWAKPYSVGMKGTENQTMNGTCTLLLILLNVLISTLAAIGEILSLG